VPPSALEQTRREWEEGHRRFEEEARDPARAGPLLEELETVTAQLRRRVGQTFTLDELADHYAAADRWTREAVAEMQPTPGWPRRLSLVTDEAFHRYSRGAVDYRP
jgi:hypothetical protein